MTISRDTILFPGPGSYDPIEPQRHIPERRIVERFPISISPYSFSIAIINSREVSVSITPIPD